MPGLGEGGLGPIGAAVGLGRPGPGDGSPRSRPRASARGRAVYRSGRSCSRRPSAWLHPSDRRRRTSAWPAEMGFLDAEDALPFEEILAPFVLVARERLAGRTAAFGKLLSAAARAALERSLLRSLSIASGELLLTEFEAMRAREQSSWDRLFALAQEPEGRSLYRRFVRRLGEGGMARLLRRYPVLARQLGTISQLWVEANAEFLGRLEADMPELERLFGDEGFGDVVELEPSLSDPHRGRRSVLALTFASGLKLVYKPKDMGTEAAYHRLLAWLNELARRCLSRCFEGTRPLHARLGRVRGASAVPGSGRGQALLRAGGHAALPVLRARGHGLSLREHHRERRVPRAHRHGDADAPPRPCGGPRRTKTRRRRPSTGWATPCCAPGCCPAGS